MKLIGIAREIEIAELRDSWFKDHKATLTESIRGTNLHTLEWRNPASWCYAIRYVIWNNTLYISGDLGEAVHVWGQDLSFAWIANCDLAYYAEKCQASETGRNFVEWDSDLLKEYLAEETEPWAPELRDAIEDHGNTAGGWQCFLHEFYNSSTYDLDTESLSAISDAGSRVNRRCIAHWLGIKMAVEQLKKGPQ